MMQRLVRAVRGWTMYEVVMNGLGALIAASVIFAFAGLLPFGGWALIASMLTIAVTVTAANWLLAKLMGAATNMESAAVTGMILTLVLAPPAAAGEYGVLILAGVLAMASKYLIAVRRRHVFNPAAFALVAIGLIGIGQATWWVATPELLPVTLVVGAGVVYLLGRVRLVAVFAVVALIVMQLVALGDGAAGLGTLIAGFVSWPLVFFAVFMLTEPATMPVTRLGRTVFAVIVGVVFSCGLSFGPLSATPQLALVVGNLFAYVLVRPRTVRARLVSKRELAPGLHEFSFATDKPLAFAAGQYFQWTLPHKKFDLRGVRRQFTAASAPHDDELKLAVRIGPGRVSSFKRALAALEPGRSLMVAQAAGDFVLPADAARKLLWIAGGIGVTPFRAMVAQLERDGVKRDITMLYFSSKPDTFAYGVELDAAAAVGLKVHRVVTGEAAGGGYEAGTLSAELIMRLVPDLKDRAPYVSGPTGMVRAADRELVKAGVPLGRIVKDEFSGY